MPRKTIRWVLISSIFVAVLGISIWIIFRPFSNTIPLSARESALSQAEELMMIIQENPSENVPGDLPGYLRTHRCWDLLQSALALNGNEYHLAVSKEYDSQNDPSAVHDMVEVWMDVTFPDGNQIEIYYSNGGLTGCKEIE